MTSTFISGFFLSISLILAIGAQNAFVLRQGLRGEHVFAICLTCALSDAILILAGVGGFSKIVSHFPWLEPAMRYGGAAFLFTYGARSLWVALKSSEVLTPTETAAVPLLPTLTTCLVLTWLNPHVYLDTILLIGSISSQFPGEHWVFGFGAASASFVFFFALGYGAILLKPLFAKPVTWKVLEIVIAIVMWSIGLSLIWG